MLEINQIHQGDSAILIKKIEDNSIDLTVTSPPYDNLRKYKGYSFDFETIAKELYRVTKEGGVVVWVVGDATINGSETGTSFRQALFFMQCGFNLHDTMIYSKLSYPPLTHNRYEQSFEYMFVLSKGKPKTFNPIMVKCDTAGTNKPRYNSNKEFGSAVRNRNEVTITKDKKQKNNVWIIRPNNTHHNHPAMFPEKLAKDHIISWSNKGDLVLDPFIGSGTTAKVSKEQQRNFIGIEISKEYVEIAQKRLSQSVLFPLAQTQEGGNGIPPTNKLVGVLPKIYDTG